MPIKLSDEQISKYIEAFYRFDVDHDEFLSRDELFTLLENVNLMVEPAFLLSALKELKIDKDRVSKRDLLSIAKVILESKAPKNDTTTTTRKKDQFGLMSMMDVSKKVTDWFEGNDRQPTTQSFYTNDTVPRGRGNTKVGDSSNVSSPRQDVVVNITDDDSDAESDYEYYTDSSEDEIHIAPENVIASRRTSIAPPSIEDETAPLQPRQRAKSVSTSEGPEGRARSKSVSQTDGTNTKIKATANMTGKTATSSGTKSKKPQRPRGNKKPVSATQKTGQKAAPAAPALAHPKNSKAAALADPKVRKQLAQIKEYPPRFLMFMTLIQVLVFAYSIVYNQGIEPLTNNWFIGPSQLTLIQLGAKYAPCMKPDPAIPGNIFVTCHSKIPIRFRFENGSCLYYDNLNFVCGMGGLTDPAKPDQVWRFITPIFLHSGALHLLLNLFVQIKLGFKMEKNLGSLRMLLIYSISGLCGFIFSASMDPKTASVGASGCLYGLFSILYLDLFHSWPILKNPRKHFALLTCMVVFALGIGLLPFVDNYAHMGGFLAGLCSGLIFMPTVHFSSWDKAKKRFLRVAAVPILALGIGLGLYSFYTEGTSFCPWCRYLNCLPPNSKWCEGE